MKTCPVFHLASSIVLSLDWSFGIDLTEDSVPARQIVDQSSEEHEEPDVAFILGSPLTSRLPLPSRSSSSKGEEIDRQDRHGRHEEIDQPDLTNG